MVYGINENACHPSTLKTKQNIATGSGLPLLEGKFRIYIFSIIQPGTLEKNQPPQGSHCGNLLKKGGGRREKGRERLCKRIIKTFQIKLLKFTNIFSSMPRYQLPTSFKSQTFERRAGVQKRISRLYFSKFLLDI